MIIRNEAPSDEKAITEVTIAAFENHPISNHTEQFIVNALREAHALAISLVAEVEGQVVGHIAFSPVAISDGSPNWHGLGPISVLPAFQRQGIGKALVHEGLRLLHVLGSKGCFLVGDPEYYQQFGFRNIPGLVYDGIPQEFVLALPFDNTIPQGTVVFHEGFSATG
jgi:putative acetyltransferase